LLIDLWVVMAVLSKGFRSIIQVGFIAFASWQGLRNTLNTLVFTIRNRLIKVVVIIVLETILDYFSKDNLLILIYREIENLW
jgi:hypothetical protein